MRFHLPHLSQLRKSPPAPVKPVRPHDPTDDHLGARLDDAPRRLTTRKVVKSSLGFLALVALITIVLVVLNGCHLKKPEQADLVNTTAALPAGLPYDPVRWGVVTQSVDPASHSVSVLYANPQAMQTVAASPQRTGQAAPAAAGETAYGAGSVLALVTWTQRDDPHWFGARIPGNAQTVEFLEVPQIGQPRYRRFAGQPLAEVASLDAAQASARTSFLLSQTATQLP